MKTLFLNTPGQFEYADTLLDEQLATHEVLLKIHRIGICGTDYHAYRGKQPFFSYPRILGHELGAEIVALGSQVTNLQIGDKVAVEPYLHCGECQPCCNGKSNCCERLQVLGVHTDGGMREFLKVPADKVYASATLSYEQLALVETLGIGSHAVNRAQVKADDLVLVIGAGPIGLSVIQFAKLKGAQVLVMDTNARRLAFCQEQLKADQVLLLQQQDPVDQMRQAFGGNLPTAVFDATGNPNSMMQAFQYVSFGGRLTFVGLFQGEVTFNDPHFHRREITLLSSRNALPEDFQSIIQAMEQGTLDTRPWISHRVAFEQLVGTFDELLQPESNVIKVIVEM
ncbi:MAG: zinc-binding alcohol dehydrogenase family protein [Spirosomataceae bacterium]